MLALSMSMYPLAENDEKHHLYWPTTFRPSLQWLMRFQAPLDIALDAVSPPRAIYPKVGLVSLHVSRGLALWRSHISFQ